MSKALLGPATSDLAHLRLLDEVRSLRQRILDLEARLEEAEREATLRSIERESAEPGDVGVGRQNAGNVVR